MSNLVILSFCRNSHKLLYKTTSIRCISSTCFTRKSLNTCADINRYGVVQNLTFVSTNSCPFNRLRFTCLHLEAMRSFSKKKGSKRSTEVKEESDSDDDYDDEEYESFQHDDNESLVTKTVPSMRLDTILKAGFSVKKKKVEKDFYAYKLRLNGNKVLKKALTISVGDEIDSVKGFTENQKFLLVDRIIIKGINKPGGTGKYPVKMEILKELTIENYEDPWSPSSMQEID